MDVEADDTFGYRPHVSWGQWIAMIVVAIPALLLMGLSLYQWWVLDTWSPFLSGVALLLGLEALGIFALNRALATSIVRLDEEGLAFANYRKEGRWAYDEIESVRGRYLPYIGGWLTIEGPDTTLRLTVVLDDIDAFVARLHDRLRSLEAPPFDRDNLFGFYKTAVYSDQSWDRLYGDGYNLGRLAATFGASSGVVWLATSAWSLSATLAAVVSFGIALPVLVVGIGEFVLFARYVAREADREAFHVPHEMPDTLRQRYVRYILATGVGLASLSALVLWRCTLGCG
jgi:hypothetical protein